MSAAQAASWALSPPAIPNSYPQTTAVIRIALYLFPGSQHQAAATLRADAAPIVTPYAAGRPRPILIPPGGAYGALTTSFKISRSTLSSAFPGRNLLYFARSPAVNGNIPLALGTPRSAVSALTQFPSVVSLIDSSRAT